MPEGEPSLPWRPWRSAAAGWVVAAVALVAGVPLFLAMPPWCDVTLYQMAARNVLHGGVHYRDIFDTNLPGFVWLMAACQSAYGLNYAALRAVDLCVIGGSVAVLCGWVRRCGGGGAAVAWLVAAAALFYPFTSEFSHIQRDPWMLLPAALAARLRLRRVSEVKPLAASHARSSLLEGALWGAAVWLKPHVVIPAFAVWVVSAVLLARREPRRRVAADFAALVAGGLLAGAPGVAWLVGTGAWPHFLDIFLNWNPAYLADLGSLEGRLETLFAVFGPWSWLHAVAFPLSILSLWKVRTGASVSELTANAPRPRWRLSTPAADESAAGARALLAALYLGWLVQVIALQKGLDYVHVPPLLLAFAVVVAHGWSFAFAHILWFSLVGVLVNLGALPPVLREVGASEWRSRFGNHTLADPDVMRLWPRACREGGTPELRDRIGQYTDIHCGTQWRELAPVAEFLRTVEPRIGPRELNCWHDSTHPLYLMLDLDPATRYMHYGTAFGIRETHPPAPGEKSKRAQIADAVRASRQRYVVSDLLRAAAEGDVYDPSSWRDGDPLPVWLPANEREKFPWNQPIVFRSGRYTVHQIDPTRPLGTIRVPDWVSLRRLASFGPDE